MISLGQYAQIDMQGGVVLLTAKLPLADLLQKVYDSASNEIEKEVLAVAIAALKGLSPAPAA